MNVPTKILVLVIAVVLMIAGCAVRNKQQISFYSLSDMTLVDLGAHGLVNSDVAIAIGPVTIPDYLKRAQIATRIDSRLYRFSEFHRWSGLIEQDIVTVVGNNLGLVLGTDNIASYPWLDHFNPDYRVTVDFQRFDGDLNGDAQLVARWAVSDSTGKKSLASGKSDLRVPVAEPTYLALVNAESRLLTDFSKELATHIKKHLSSRDLQNGAASP